MHHLLLAVVCICAGVGAAEVAKTAKPLTVQGIVEAYRFASISPEIPGRVIRIDVPEGKVARKGDTLLRIEYSEEQLNVQRARIIAESRADLVAARSKFETAQKDYDATKQVYDSTSAVSEEEVWKKKLELDLAKADFDRLTSMEEKEQVEYAIALQRLKAHFIIAPYDGVVASVLVREWEDCKISDPVIRFVDLHKCRFVTYVPANRSQSFVKGRKVTVSINGASSVRNRVGIVDFVSPIVDPASGLRTIKIVFDNADRSIAPGVTGSLVVEN